MKLLVFFLCLLFMICVGKKIKYQRKPIVTDKVYFNITIDNEPIGQIVIGLFGAAVPKTVRNFKELAERSEGKGYKGSKIHRVIQNFVVQGGDYTTGDGTGGESIFGKPFKDENFNLKHYGVGWVNMANYGPNTNRAQFSILLRKAKWLDNHHVVFGKVLSGMKVVRKIEGLETTAKDWPLSDVVIVDSGSIPVDEPFAVPRTDAEE